MNNHRAHRTDNREATIRRGDKLLFAAADMMATFAYVADDGRIATQEPGRLPRLWASETFEGITVELNPFIPSAATSPGSGIPAYGTKGPNRASRRKK